MAVSFCNAQISKSSARSDVDDVVRFTNVCRLLSSLAVHADDIFGVLLAECQKVAERTDRLNKRLRSGLVDTVTKLDARTARRPKRNLSAMVKPIGNSVLESGDFHARYGYDCHLLAPSTRPDSVCKLYAAADTSPCHVISACDRYRGDGFSGCCIFSPCLTLQATTTDCTDLDDVTESYWESDEPSSVSSIRSVSALASLSIAASKRPARAPRLSANNSTLCVNEPSPQVATTLANCNEIETQVVPVDVTGSSFAAHSSKPLQSIARKDAVLVNSGSDELDDAPIRFGFAIVRRRRDFKKRSKDSVDHRARRSTTDSVIYDRVATKRVEKYAPVSLTRVVSRRRPATVSRLKRASRSDDFESKSSLLCSSWRHSFCSASKQHDDERKDLLVENRIPPVGYCSISSKHIEKSRTVIRRSNSLPRSFGNSRTVSPKRLKSIPAKEETVSVSGAARSRRIEPGSNTDELNLPPHAELSDGKLKKRSLSLDRLTSRRSLRRLLPRFCSATSKYLSMKRTPSSVDAPSGGDGCVEVQIDIPDRPWTKPFATVKLRPRSGVDTESYRSSSGHWSMSASQSLNCDSFNPTMMSAEVHCSDSDSAVSLTLDGHKRNTTGRHDSVISDTIDSSSGGSGKSTRLLEDQLSVFSIDQEGFYTSMHADSGLTRAARRRFETITAAQQSDSHERSTQCPPAPVQLTPAHVDSLTSSLQPAGNSFNVSTSIEELRSPTSSQSSLLPRADTCVTPLDDVTGPKRQCGDSFLSLVALNSPSSEEEDTELLDWRRDWKDGAVDDQQTALSNLQSASSFGSSKTVCEQRGLGSSRCALNQRQDEEVDGFSTWPCSPVIKTANEPSSSVRGILKSSSSNGSAKKVSGPRTITFSPFTDMSLIGSTSPTLDFSQSSETDQKLKKTTVPSFLTNHYTKDCVQDTSCSTSNTNDKEEDEMDWLTLTKSLMTSSDDVTAAVCRRWSDSSSSPIRDLIGVSARLVISSPISKKTSFVENSHRRLICQSVTRDQVVVLAPETTSLSRLSSSSSCSDRCPPVRCAKSSDLLHENDHEFTLPSCNFSTKTMCERNSSTDRFISSDVGRQSGVGRTSPGGRVVFDAENVQVKDELTRSTDSISSTLSAAERTLTAKLAFIGLDYGSKKNLKQDRVAGESSEFALPLLVNRLLNSGGESSSCSSSGMGSSASASPMDSPISNSSSRYVEDAVLYESTLVASASSSSDGLDHHSNNDVSDQFDFQQRGSPEEAYIAHKFTMQTSV